MSSITEAKKLTNMYLDIGMPAFWWGKPGIGKTDAVYQLAEDMGCSVKLFTSNVLEPVDLRGLPAVDRDPKTGVAINMRWLSPADLPNEKRDGKSGILFLDDVLTAPPAMQAPLFGLALTGRIADYQLPKGWHIIAASNYTTDKAGANRINLALANRFGHVEVTPTLDDFCKWCIDNAKTIPGHIPAFLRYRPKHLHDMMDVGPTGAFPSPRQWAKVGRILTNLDSSPASDTLRHQAISGLIGPGAAAEFEGFMHVYRTLPNLDKVLADPVGTPTPTEVSAMYAVATALARKVNPKTFANAMTYMERVGKEFSVVTVIDALKITPAIQQTPVFAKWAANNQSIMLGS